MKTPTTRGSDPTEVDVSVNDEPDDELDEPEREEPGTALVTIEQPPETDDDQRALDLLPEDQEPRFTHTETVREDQRSPSDEGATIVTFAQLKSYSVRDASNGANVDATWEVDALTAADFDECLGEQTFILVFDKVDSGECRVVSVTSKADADNKARTKVATKWSQDQRPKTRWLSDIVGQTRRLELWQVQLTVFGAKPE